MLFFTIVANAVIFLAKQELAHDPHVFLGLPCLLFALINVLSGLFRNIPGFFHKKIQDIYFKYFSNKSFRLFSQDKWSLINNTRIRSLFYRSNILGSQSHPYLAKKVSTEKVTKIA